MALGKILNLGCGHGMLDLSTLKSGEVGLSGLGFTQELRLVLRGFKVYSSTSFSEGITSGVC